MAKLKTRSVDELLGSDKPAPKKTVNDLIGEDKPKKAAAKKAKAAPVKKAAAKKAKAALVVEEVRRLPSPAKRHKAVDPAKLTAEGHIKGTNIAKVAMWKAKGKSAQFIIDKTGIPSATVRTYFQKLNDSGNLIKRL